MGSIHHSDHLSGKIFTLRLKKHFCLSVLTLIIVLLLLLFAHFDFLDKRPLEPG